ncbi:MAG: glycoside hydrolase family 65 protein [Prevotella sp.]|jgi:trehalose/maltose hydrolase-like predicted phosphorylase
MRKIALTVCWILCSLASYAQDPWILKADQINPENYYGETVANGMLGLVSSPTPMKLSATVLAGCYDKFGRGEVSNFLRGFNFLDTELEINGIALTTDNIKEHIQRLDMRNALLQGDFLFEGQAKITYRFYSLRELPYCGIQTINIVPLKDLSLRVRNYLNKPEGFKNFQPRFEQLSVGHANLGLQSALSASPTGKMQVAACSSFLFQDSTVPNISNELNDSSQYETFTIQLKKGERFSFAVAGSTMSSSHHSDPINEVKRLTIYCQMQGIAKLLEQHRKEWEQLWASDIIVEGDPQSQQDIHSMMYHLYSFLREGSEMSISPMGLSGLGYNGHIFWDADTWMMPALLLLHPELAESMIDYRYNRLKAAKQNAFEHGYKGAMYPWESAETGNEDTPVMAMTGPFEHSITGCVGVAAWQYYCVTRDKQWLQEKGYPILKETADYWLSRVALGKDGFYHINNVVAADEWAENIDDDAFTNGVAILNLLCASKAASELGIMSNEQWREVADKIKIWKFSNGVTKEYSTYEGQDIKQCDVNLLAFPLKLVTSKDSILADLEYYRKKLPEKDTPAMTQAIFSLLYSRLGNQDMAWYYFQDAYKPNQLPPFGVIAECKGGTNPYFVTGAGGVLQCVLMGFGGLDIDYENTGIKQVSSVLPHHWKSLKMTSIGPDKQCVIITNPSYTPLSHK